MSRRILSFIVVLGFLVLTALGTFDGTSEASHTNDGVCYKCPKGTMTSSVTSWRTYPGGPGFGFGRVGTEDLDENSWSLVVYDSFNAIWVENGFKVANGYFTPTKYNVGNNSMGLWVRDQWYQPDSEHGVTNNRHDGHEISGFYFTNPLDLSQTESAYPVDNKQIENRVPASMGTRWHDHLRGTDQTYHDGDKFVHQFDYNDTDYPFEGLKINEDFLMVSATTANLTNAKMDELAVWFDDQFDKNITLDNNNEMGDSHGVSTLNATVDSPSSNYPWHLFHHNDSLTLIQLYRVTSGGYSPVENGEGYASFLTFKFVRQSTNPIVWHVLVTKNGKSH